MATKPHVVSVDTDRLIEVIRAKKAQMESEYEEKMEKWRAGYIEHLRKCVEVAQVQLGEALAGGTPAQGRYYTNSGGYFDRPRIPESLDRDIALLEMSSDDTIKVSTDSNWMSYLG